MKKKSLLLVVFVMYTFFVNAQRNCGTNENLISLSQKNGDVLKKYLDVEKSMIDLEPSVKRRTQVVVTIPVVVHVIHNNEAIGIGTNISDLQVESQIEALNEDYRLMNADSLTPTHPFWQYTADALIEFCLAKQTPGGQPTTGIERIFGGLDWTMDDCNNTLKPQTIWDASRYLNLWTVDWGGANSDLLGFAQFPGGGPASTDGVVIGYQYFGYTGNVTPPFDYGRTATHEIGHWLGLRHIWGDAFCGDDLISDTPGQESENLHCPTFPVRPSNACGTNGNGEMFMNYMDYVDDRCMVMFTYEQAVRMNTALYGPRASLITSNGCSTPNPGIDENILFGQKILVYPNPSTGHFKFIASDLGSNQLLIKVTDLTGRLIKTLSIDNSGGSKDLDFTDLSNGTYLIEFNQKDLKAIKKVNLIR